MNLLSQQRQPCRLFCLFFLVPARCIPGKIGIKLIRVGAQEPIRYGFSVFSKKTNAVKAVWAGIIILGVLHCLKQFVLGTLDGTFDAGIQLIENFFLQFLNQCGIRARGAPPCCHTAAFDFIGHIAHDLIPWKTVRHTRMNAALLPSGKHAIEWPKPMQAARLHD